MNLSSIALNDNELKLPNKKGLKFKPTPSADHGELKNDMLTFCRRLRLSE